MVFGGALVPVVLWCIQVWYLRSRRTFRNFITIPVLVVQCAGFSIVSYPLKPTALALSEILWSGSVHCYDNHAHW